MRKILIIGANSSIAQQTARLFATCGDQLYLLSRNYQHLELQAEELMLCGAKSISYKSFDAKNYATHTSILNDVIDCMQGLDIVLIAHGTLSDQKNCSADFKQTLNELNINAISIISLLIYLGNYFEQKGKGSIAVLCSVAGDRGRQSNYTYGAAKGMVAIYLQGLRNRLYHSGVNVLTVKLGYIETPMTAHLDKNVLWVKSEVAAKKIFQAILTGKNEIYVPFFWYYIMWVVKCLPEQIFKRLNL